MQRALVLLMSSAMLVAAGCRDAGRGSTRPTFRTNNNNGNSNNNSNPDTGVADDAGETPDLGFVDAGQPVDSGPAPVDAGPRDTGIHPDAGRPADAITVYDCQDPSRPAHPGMDGAVHLVDVIVTAVVSGGQSDGSFWVQEPAGGPFSGVLVFRPSEVPVTGVQVGDVVSLRGTLVEYFDVTEVVLVALETAVPGNAPIPQSVVPSELANGSPSAEQWEGVLVRINNVLVLDDMPDAPDDFGEWVVTGGLRIDDQIFGLDPRPTVGTNYSSIVGIHHHSFENYKVLPRSAADFIP